MDGPHLFGHVSVADRPLFVHELATALMAGRSALVTGPAGTEELLAALAQSFAATRTRILRARPPLGLPDFMEQVAPPDVAAGDPGLVQGYLALTTPDQTCDRIVLLVESAHLLPHATLRYIGLALRAGPHLRVVFGGRSEIADVLALDDFAGLRQRLSLHLALPEQVPVQHIPEPVSAAAATPGPASVKRGLRWPMAMAAATAVGSVILAAWLSQPVSPPPAPSAGPELAGAEAVLVAGSASHPAPQPSVTAAPSPDPAPEPDQSSAAIEPPPTMPQPAIATPGANPDPEPASLAAAREAPTAPAPPLVDPVPEPPRETPAVLVVTPAPAPLLRQRLQPIPPPSRSERVAARPSPSREDERRCLGIIQRVQLGDTPTDGDRTFLRNGCR